MRVINPQSISLESLAPVTSRVVEPAVVESGLIRYISVVACLRITTCVEELSAACSVTNASVYIFRRISRPPYLQGQQIVFAKIDHDRASSTDGTTSFNMRLIYAPRTPHFSRSFDMDVHDTLAVPCRSFQAGKLFQSSLPHMFRCCIIYRTNR
jgi:hypothetical protein